MARPFPNNISIRPQGRLLIEEVHPGYNEIYFVPPDEALMAGGLDPSKADSYKRLILDINSQNDYITIYPINTLPTHKDFLLPKYPDLLSITLDGLGYSHADIPFIKRPKYIPRRKLQFNLIFIRLELLLSVF